MRDRLRRWFCLRTSVTFTIACVHCDFINIFDAEDVRVQVVDGSPDTYLTARCQNCRKVTPTKVTFEIADKALAGGARCVPFRDLPPIRERDIAAMMENIDAEYDALCEAWC